MVEEEISQEEQNQVNAHEKSSKHKGLKTLSKLNKGKSKGKNVINIVNLKKKLFVAGIIIAVTIVVGILLAGTLWVVDKWKTDNVNDAKQAAIVTSYSGGASTSETDEAGNIVNKVVVKPNSSKTNYEISYNSDSENIEDIKDKLEEQTSVSASKFTDFELGIFGALMDNGANLDYYTEEQLHCFASFIKAEACTQYLDLRPNSQKILNGEYVPAKSEDLNENEVPGVILVQRTNTNGDSSTTLEYKAKADFDKLVQENNKDAINYFTLSDEGNLIIAKWNYEKVTVTGTYPENLDKSEKETSKEENIITTEEIPYRQYITKYTMPFELLVQLLVITEEPEFCTELVDHVLDSKIVINVQEEETITETDETKVYTVHQKDERRIGYEIKAYDQEITQGNDYFLNYAKDDKGKECTNYSVKNYPVDIYKKYINHTYVFEIVEADTWIAHYTKEYQPKDPETDVNDYAGNVENEYKSIKGSSEILSQPWSDDQAIKRFISETKANYEPKIIVPSLIVSTYQDDDGNNYKTITKSNGGGYVGPSERYYEIKDEEGEGTGTYNLPATITITTNEIPATDKTAKIPNIGYTFSLNQSGNEYVLQNSGEKISCNINNRSINFYEKINSETHTDTTITKHPADPNPTTNTHIYATQSGEPGNGHKDEETVYEKFLVAYDNSSGARNNLNSIDSWLYEMMEENEVTVEFVDIIKYLFYMYDGKDRGVTELEDFENIFNPDEFVSASSGGNISLTTPTLSREDFIKAMEEYNGGGNFNTNFKSRAAEIYDLGIKYGVNPELVVTFAKKEGSFKPAGGQNYWGLDTPNGASSAYFDTFENGVKRLAEIFNTYMPGGKQASLIANRKKERSAANCNTNGYGDPGTLKGVLSVYSDLCGDKNTKHREGNSSDGGNYYLKAIYGDEFEAKCGSVHKLGIDDYTIQEKADYTAYLYEQQIQFWTEIFGKYGSISSGGSINDINLYNDDGSVNQTAINNLEADLTNRVYARTDKEMKTPINTLDYLQCTWWAYTRATQYLEQYGTKYKQYPRLNGRSGNGGEWYDINRQGGWFEYGQEPRPNSIISWKWGTYGHVAYVEAVDYINGKIYISHAGSGTDWYGIGVLDISGYSNGVRPNGYIYLDSPK